MSFDGSKKGSGFAHEFRQAASFAGTLAQGFNKASKGLKIFAGSVAMATVATAVAVGAVAGVPEAITVAGMTIGMPAVILYMGARIFGVTMDNS